MWSFFIPGPSSQYFFQKSKYSLKSEILTQAHKPKLDLDVTSTKRFKRVKFYPRSEYGFRKSLDDT